MLMEATQANPGRSPADPASPAGRAGGRPLRGEKPLRIVAAMRESVAEVGVAGSTFERVASKAGVSRGLLHYYFGTKERLLIEVMRRDTEARLESLCGELRRAESLDAMVAALLGAFGRGADRDLGYAYLVGELFVAGRQSAKLRRELGALLDRARSEVSEILREKEAQGIVSPRLDLEGLARFALGDGSHTAPA
jgi:AcrR family transcriptional regulator